MDRWTGSHRGLFVCGLISPTGVQRSIHLTPGTQRAPWLPPVVSASSCAACFHIDGWDNDMKACCSTSPHYSMRCVLDWKLWKHMMMSMHCSYVFNHSQMNEVELSILKVKYLLVKEDECAEKWMGALTKGGMELQLYLYCRLIGQFCQT